MTEQDLLERRSSREDLLKLAAAAGGAGAPGEPGGAAACSADAAHRGERPAAGARLGRVRQRRRPVDVRAVREAHPQNKPQFTYMTNEADALAKLHAGLKPDLFRPYVGWVKYFATSGLVQPWDPTLIPNFKQPEPVHGQGRPVQRQAVRHPRRLGLRRDPLPNRQGARRRRDSWGLLFDERYKGKIAWYDDLEMLIDRPGSTSGSRIRGTRPTRSSNSRRSSSSRRSTSSG